MGKDKLKVERGEPALQLVAEKNTSLSSGNLRLYASVGSPLSTLRSPLIVGCVDLYNYDPLNRRCAVGIMVATEHRRQGYALAMLKKLEELYTQPLSHSNAQPLHQFYADIAATNTSSLALFRKVGYTQCGHFRDWLLVNDQYIDSIRMQKTL